MQTFTLYTNLTLATDTPVLTPLEFPYLSRAQSRYISGHLSGLQSKDQACVHIAGQAAFIAHLFGERPWLCQGEGPTVNQNQDRGEPGHTSISSLSSRIHASPKPPPCPVPSADMQ